MFLGQYIHTIDEKGRLTIPAKFRGSLSAGLVITRWLDRCLVIYPMETWRSVRERISSLPMTDQNARDFRRLVYSGAMDTVPDGQGRINIPQPLREYAGLDGQAVIVGCDTYIEIWSPEAWEEVQARVEQSEDNAERWASLGI
ncbi:MAG TPA: division/cell wall cluster transcriptional repressor MraZ [Thermoflexia bacterium]|jgi:MraZ protein|nr:division/cell wall cluster transcriptional repressor MraZ [Thermoflexia bacterium]